jgi:hypothetical protein
MEPSRGWDFWLYLADGGSVHFVGGPSGYQATEIYDPHGLRTDLHYNAYGQLDTVTQEGGRWLSIEWCSHPGWGQEVIHQVTSGRPGTSATQSVEYCYAIQPNTQWLVLTKVKYPETHPDIPTTDHRVFASYTYEGLGTLYEPRLATADDPHFAGAMTKIAYTYRGTKCIKPHTTPDPQPPPYV